MIKTVIFDIGNVLTTFSFHDFVKSFGFSDDIVKRLAKATVVHDVWNELDRGFLSAEEVMDLFIANDEGIEAEIRRVFNNTQGIVKKCEYAIPWVKELKEKGLQVLYLSNYSEKFRKEGADELDFIAYMDGGIFSYEVELIKPMKEIYKAIQKKYNLNPEECVFIDDLEANIQGAKECGFQTILFDNYENVVKKLNNLL